ncbi:MAG: hypothetical protein NT166_22655 [Candidatus Aminicenantes bacterium]|nr:hypothetical protein [Candidatus Aminicenantes bacterium]
MPYTKEQSKIKIEELVNDFKANEARLRNQAEAMIENNFIRPLFDYLNWNTRNVGLPAPVNARIISCSWTANTYS